MEQMKYGYKLYIKGGCEGKDILFVVRDNGVGIPDEKLARLRRHIFGVGHTGENHEFGIGLKNIQERLALFYGEGYGLTILSNHGEYTEMRVRIPKMDNGEEGNLWLQY